VPELPEVETVRRRLEPHLGERTIAAARVHDTRLVDPARPDDVAAALAGATVTTLGRRGKYLLVHLADGSTLVVHLRMTGNLLLAAPATPAHIRAELDLDDGATVLYTDQRRFGTWRLVADDEALDQFLATRVGLEPLDPDFTWRSLQTAFRGRRAPVKALVLDQRLVGGVGNIYADEALHAARIHPLTPGGALSPAALRRLADALRAALEMGIEAQGATIRDFRTPAGGYGSMQERFRVFGRDGEPCPVCGKTIVKLRVAGRGTYICPHCQRLPRPS
jgi:formamidopyrimidine-DNA glycosylase